MMALPDLKFALPKMKRWTPIVKEAASQTGESRERLIALMWRETWCGFAPGYRPRGDPCGFGDKGNGFGLFQIDKRYHPTFVNIELARCVQAGKKYSPITQALYACGVLKAARDWFKRSASSVTGQSLERAVYAAYNAGEHAVYMAVMSRKDPDAPTTGHDYSGFIFVLAEVLKQETNSWIWS